VDHLAITLSRAEGEFLHHQITATQPDSLLGQVLMDGRALDEFLGLRQNAVFDDLVDLPFVRRLSDRRLQRDVRLARLFWDILRGAHIRYNCLLQERFGKELLRREFAGQWSEWRKQMRSLSWDQWNTSVMWEVVASGGRQVKRHTRDFINEWVALAQNLPSNTTAFDKPVFRQERANKRGRARLRLDNRNETVNGWIGIASLNYRLPQAWRIVTDIHQAETGKADASVGFER